MSVTFQLPDDIEQQLRHDLAGLDEVAKEAALVELYRQAKITHHQWRAGPEPVQDGRFTEAAQCHGRFGYQGRA